MYSLDLRKKVIEAYLEGEESLRQIAERFKVSFTFVYQMWTKYKKTGDVKPLEYKGRPAYKLGAEQLNKLVEKVLKSNDLTQKELATEYEKETGIKISQSTLSRKLAKVGISRKKKPITTPKEKPQRSTTKELSSKK